MKIRKDLSDSENKDSPRYREIEAAAPPGFLSFLHRANLRYPDLFSDSPSSGCSRWTDLIPVFKAWERLDFMRVSKEKWSEADFVANVSVHYLKLLTKSHS